jgi:hypothetical protein
MMTEPGAIIATKGTTRKARAVTLCAVALSTLMVAWSEPGGAQEVIFVKSLAEAEKAVDEARLAEAEAYAPDDYLLALLYLTQAKDEASAYKARQQETKERHLFSARTSGEAVNLLAEKARYQARLATTKATEVKLSREITAIKAQIVESFNTDLTRGYSPTREDLLNELSDRESQRDDARRQRESAESEVRRLTLEGDVKPPSR